MIDLFKKLLKWLSPYGLIILKEKRRQKQQEKDLGYNTYQKEILPKLNTQPLLFLKSPNLKVYGQGAEDLLLRAYIKSPESFTGFYIDIGAYHPVQASNTKYFYDAGWRGINIDANPESAAIFKQMRPRDINLNIGVSDENGSLDYYYFGPKHSINTFNKSQAEAFSAHFNLAVKEVIKMPVRHINEVLIEHVPANTPIDFMSIDVEGMEGKILSAIDFKSFHPKFLLVEDISLEGEGLDFETWKKLQSSWQHQFIVAQEYEFLAKTKLSLLYRSKKKEA